MILEIPDDLQATTRRHLLDVMAIDYALMKFNGNRVKVCAWLGISRRNLTDKIREVDSLKKWYVEPHGWGRYCNKK
jgi:DNA-binding NtrC family response regulator